MMEEWGLLIKSHQCNPSTAVVSIDWGGRVQS